MNHHKFEYLKPSERRSHVATTGSPTLASPTSNVSSFGTVRHPIRVTPSALEWLLYVIIHTVEFHAPSAPRPKNALGTGTSQNSASKSGTAAAVVLPAAAAVTSVMASVWEWGTGSVIARTASLSPDARASKAREEKLAQEAALRELQLSAPTVVPVTQQIPSLGDVHVVVLHDHNKTIAPALSLAIKRIRTLQEEKKREDRSARKALRDAAAAEHRERQQRELEISPAPDGSDAAASFYSDRRPDSLSTPGNTADEVLASGDVRRASREGVHSPVAQQPREPPSFPSEPSSGDIAPQYPLRQSRPPHVSPGSVGGGGGVSRQSARGPSPGRSPLLSMPSIDGSSSTTTFSAPPFGVLPGELGMEWSVRLSSTVPHRWRASKQDALAELTFPVILTADETSVLSCLDLPAEDSASVFSDAPARELWCASPAVPGAATRVATPEAARSSVDRLLFANDPSQIHDVIMFISESFNRAISMDTFADFTAGELVFDVQVTEKKRFAAPKHA